MSSEALVAAVGLSDFVSIHLTLICLPSTPPALLICVDPHLEELTRLEVVRAEDARLGRRDPDQDRSGGIPAA